MHWYKQRIQNSYSSNNKIKFKVDEEENDEFLRGRSEASIHKIQPHLDKYDNSTKYNLFYRKIISS